MPTITSRTNGPDVPRAIQVCQAATNSLLPSKPGFALADGTNREGRAHSGKSARTVVLVYGGGGPNRGRYM